MLSSVIARRSRAGKGINLDIKSNIDIDSCSKLDGKLTAGMESCNNAKSSREGREDSTFHHSTDIYRNTYRLCIPLYRVEF